MMAVIRRAEAALHAFIKMRSSMTPSLMSLGFVDWITKTIFHEEKKSCPISLMSAMLGNLEEVLSRDALPSSSRTLSPMTTLVS